MNRGVIIFVGVLASCSTSPRVEMPVTRPKTVSSQPAEERTRIEIASPTDARCVDYALPGAGPLRLDPPEHVAEVPSHAYRMPSGLSTCVLVASSSEVRAHGLQDRARIRWSGWTTDGERFSASMEGTPTAFPLFSIIEGWAEGILLMRVGERRRLWIPQSLGYAGIADGPAGVLVIDVELVDVQTMPELPSTPLDVAEPPGTATRTSSGLYSRVLQPGTGNVRPTEASIVTFHHSDWTTDGVMFDSSWTRGHPSRYPLVDLIDGCTEGIQLMVVGEKRRFWIPRHLAYEDREGPQGMLVLDIELLAIE